MLLHGCCLPLDSSGICPGLEKDGHLVPVAPMPLAIESWVPCGCSVSGEQPQGPVATLQVRAGREVRRKIQGVLGQDVITAGHSFALPRASVFILSLNNRFIGWGWVLVLELQFSFLLSLNN